MDFIGFEIVASLASLAVLFSVTAAAALLLLSGLAAKVLLYLEDICARWEARLPNSRPASTRYGTDVDVERGNAQ
jgi:hypothetical protein